MSYIRASGAYVYVDEDECADYVFCSVGYGEDAPDFIEDYGSITDNGLIELLYKYWDTEDTLFKDHIIKRLAERLEVKLRDKSLTDEEEEIIFRKQMKRYENER